MSVLRITITVIITVTVMGESMLSAVRLELENELTPDACTFKKRLSCDDVSSSTFA